MKRAMRWAMAVAMAGAVMAPGVWAEDSTSSAKPLPTLRIKGKVESVDKSDPSSTLLKVTDRYGFQTPIYLAGDTKIVRGGQAGSIEDLQQGAETQVTYNFDINTAKRHAVEVELVGSQTASAPAAEAAPVSAPAVIDAVPTPIETPAAAPEAPAATEPAAEATAQ